MVNSKGISYYVSLFWHFKSILRYFYHIGYSQVIKVVKFGLKVLISPLIHNVCLDISVEKSKTAVIVSLLYLYSGCIDHSESSQALFRDQ